MLGPMNPPSPFDRAWTSAAQAGLGRPDTRPMADPMWSEHDPHVAWWAAALSAEVVSFQLALGQWTEEALPSMGELKQALRGLRKGAQARGPQWFRRATRWWRQSNLDLWRQTIESAKQAAWQRQNQTRHLMEACGHARQALDEGQQRVENWQAENPDAADLASPWLMQAQVQEASLMLLEQRAGLRWSQEKHLVTQLNQASALVEMVRTTQGSAQETAWKQLSSELPTLDSLAPRE